MINPKTKNIRASVKARLLNLSRKRNRSFQETLQYYGMERFLFRLSKSKHRKLFILKGALLFKAWNLNNARATVDIDMSARTSNSLDNLIVIVRDICKLDFVEQDGITFHSHTITGEMMQIQREYQGIRVKFEGNLESARIPMQLDFGFGDVITPAPQDIDYPVLLDLPSPHLQGYPPETVIAEKLQTMIERGLLNSRIKDYYDVWMLLRWCDIRSEVLKNAIIRTFDKRATAMQLPALVQVLHKYGLSEEHQISWNHFCKKNSLLDIAPQSLSKICEDIANHLTKELF